MPRDEEPIQRRMVEGPGRDLEERETHPAFGVVRFGRSQGNPGKLFGSHLNDHAGVITMSVKRAERNHHLSRDWIHGTEEVVELEMSFVQFATAMTSMNMGEGVPCTLRYIQREMVPGIPDDLETEQEKVAAGFEQDAREFGGKVAERFKEIETILDKPGNIGKRDREAIRGVMAMVIQDVNSNMPFVLQSFVESTEKVASAAKAEVEGFLTGVLHRAGLDGLKEKILGMPGMPGGRELPSGDED